MCLSRILAAVYQLPDGLYGVTSGVLRGLGMQPTLLWVNLGGFWAIGIVLGVTLTFKAQLGVMGLWWGLLSGIVSTGEGSAHAHLYNGAPRSIHWGYHSASCVKVSYSRRPLHCTAAALGLCIEQFLRLMLAALMLTSCTMRAWRRKLPCCTQSWEAGASCKHSALLCSCNLHSHPGARGLAGGGAQGAGRAGGGRADGRRGRGRGGRGGARRQRWRQPGAAPPW